MQLVFGYDTLMNLTFNVNWYIIKQRKQQLINESNAKENSKQIENTYKVYDLLLVKNKQSSKYGKYAYNNTWTIQEVHDNGTVNISKVLVSDVYNIQNITPYFSL